MVGEFNGISVLFTEHDMDVVFAHADRILVLNRGRLILLDEPSEGLAPVIVDQMARTIQALKREGLTVVLSEQNTRFATRVADRGYIIEKDRIRYEGTMRELAEDEEVRQAYLTV